MWLGKRIRDGGGFPRTVNERTPVGRRGQGRVKKFPRPLAGRFQEEVAKGPSIYDVLTGGGGGGFKCWLILRTNSTDRLREMQTKKGRVGV